MIYHNLVKVNYYNASIIGIFLVIPVVGVESKNIIATFNRCEKCNQFFNFDSNYCQNCGGKIIEVTESLKFSNGQEETQEVPIPDIRNEIKSLGIEDYIPFTPELEKEKSNWTFIIKKYFKIYPGTDSSLSIDELVIYEIQEELLKAKKKFKDVLKKYNAKIVFGKANTCLEE